jgi:hypothetical protein
VSEWRGNGSASLILETVDAFAQLVDLGLQLGALVIFLVGCRRSPLRLEASDFPAQLVDLILDIQRAHDSNLGSCRRTLPQPAVARIGR